MHNEATGVYFCQAQTCTEMHVPGSVLCDLNVIVHLTSVSRSVQKHNEINRMSLSTISFEQVRGWQVIQK